MRSDETGHDFELLGGFCNVTEHYLHQKFTFKSKILAFKILKTKLRVWLTFSPGNVGFFSLQRLCGLFIVHICKMPELFDIPYHHVCVNVWLQGSPCPGPCPDGPLPSLQRRPCVTVQRVRCPLRPWPHLLKLRRRYLCIPTPTPPQHTVTKPHNMVPAWASVSDQDIDFADGIADFGNPWLWNVSKKSWSRAEWKTICMLTLGLGWTFSSSCIHCIHIPTHSIDSCSDCLEFYLFLNSTYLTWTTDFDDLPSGERIKCHQHDRDESWRCLTAEALEPSHLSLLSKGQ